METVECVECGAPVDRLRDTTRIVGSRIVLICKACTAAGSDGRRPERATTSDLWSAESVGDGGRRGGEGTAPWQRYAAAGGLLGALALMTWLVQSYAPAKMAAADSLSSRAGAWQGEADRAPTPGGQKPGAAGAGAHAIDLALEPALDIGGKGNLGDQGADEDGEVLEIEDPEDITVSDELPPTLEDVLENSEEPLHERLPTLADWVFPVLGSDEAFPLKVTRRFGAARDGVARTECGQGHCGVDLDGPRGTTVVAVAWGVVTRIERRSNRRSGKYVRIEHPDYVYTSYMHLDEIADGLKVGDEIQAGDVVGTLGRTGILHSAPHLHFSLEVPGSGRLMHIDPGPYLVNANRLPER